MEPLEGVLGLLEAMHQSDTAHLAIGPFWFFAELLEASRVARRLYSTFPAAGAKLWRQ